MSTFALNIKSERTSIEKHLIKLEAWARGQNPWVTVDNDGSKNKPFIRKRANEVWGDPRLHWLDAKKMKKDEE